MTYKDFLIATTAKKECLIFPSNSKVGDICNTELVTEVTKSNRVFSVNIAGMGEATLLDLREKVIANKDVSRFALVVRPGTWSGMLEGSENLKYSKRY